MAHLGWLAPERATPQAVEIDIRLYFPKAPACMGDDNGGFLDYHGLCDKVRAVVETREFRLIEYMSNEVFAAARQFADASKHEDVRIWLRLSKSEAPVPNLENGAGFVLSDLAADATVVAAV